MKIAAAALPEKLLKLHAALTIQASNLHFFNIFLQHREKLHAALILFRVKLRSFFRLFWEKQIILVLQATPFKDWSPPDNVRIIYKTGATFDHQLP